MGNLKAYLQLTRPANLVTALADILAGVAIAQFTFYSPYLVPGSLLLATLGLYGGGVVMNDVFDAELDAVERPERPIPSGRVSLGSATTLGVMLLLAGIAFAALYSPLSASIAALVAVGALVYDKWAKHSALLGPLTMGLCRGGNLLLGISSVPQALYDWGFLALVPVVYIGAITLISQDEVHGGKRRTLYIAASLYLLVHLVQLAVSFTKGNLLLTAPLVALHAWMIGRPLLVAIKNPVGPLIGKAVKAGVISLIIMNAAWCMAFGNWHLALIGILLLPISLKLARIFAVT
ncbi:UbiA-like protein EboC [Telluribacter sp.]|uniref:UbiA-like protein EboC n=1 Tax=Telluribacter sp. TaxID=1978767 RepID=UPI002E0F4DB0|nr:UbiA-like protein EboC [Telluribacter sp.]HEV7350466.1 UbiA-like protein EboC [Telluribacter sp.]